MPRKALRLRVELCINAVSCPGVYLPHRDDVYLSVYLLGQHRRTQLASPVFPLLFRERFKFDKVFYIAYEPSHVQDAVEHDIVLFELVQLSSTHDGGRLLASYEANAKDFLYPYPSYSPTYSTTEREILLERATSFPGIAPKVQFTTKTVIEETKKPVMTSVEAALLENIEEDHRRRNALLQRRPARSRTRSSNKRHRYLEPTVASCFRSRSLSPATYRQLEALSLEDYDTHYYDEGPREPFVVRKVDSNLIGRKPGTDYQRRRARKKRAMSATSRSLALVPHKPLRSSPRDVSPRRCLHCATPWSERKCTVCRLYRQYTGRPYTGHSPYHHPMCHNHTKVKAVREPGDYVWDDLSDLSDEYLDDEVAGLTSSYVPRPPPRPKSPILFRSSLRERYDEPSYLSSRLKYGSLSRSLGNRLNRSTEKLDRIGDRLYTSYHSSYDPVLADLDYELQQARQRSPIPIHSGEYWSQRAAQYQGKFHRDVFNSSLGKIYGDLYRTAKSRDLSV